MAKRILQLPEEPRRKFNDWVEVLSWVTRRLQSPSRRSLDASHLSSADQEVLETALILMRAGLAYGKGIQLVCRSKAAEAAYPILRSLLEIWAEFRYLMQPGGRHERVKQMRVAAGLAMMDLEGKGKGIIKEGVDHLEKIYPEAFAAVSTTRRKKGKTGHWSGGGRKDLIARMCGDFYGRLYQFLSWDVHPIVQVALDSAATSGRLHVGHRTDQSGVRERVCRTTVHIMYDMWNTFAREFSPL
jgi:hypothetical protein